MDKLAKSIETFIEDREWKQFHSPKNLSMALAGEVAEILEIFQWKTQQESSELSEQEVEHLKDEIGDVLIYLLNISSKFEIDVVEAAKSKLQKNILKYPIEKSKGNSKKYTEL